MEIPNHIQSFWKAFEASVGYAAADRFYEAFHFDDNERDANMLAELVMAGRKRATAGLLWSNESHNKPVPKPGDLSVVTNWEGQPLCVIETTRVDIQPFQEVSAEFAASEGEGDGSLRQWREDHWKYFSRECSRIGREPDIGMPVICESFEVIFPVNT